MRAEFFREDDVDSIVGSAGWTGNAIDAQAEDPKVRRALGRIYRPTAVLIDDPALRSFGTRGPQLLPPGTLQWFICATQARSGAEKLAYRLIPGESRRMGWDPAGAYRTFAAQAERREERPEPSPKAPSI
jgi:hypothetical protein